MLSIGKTKKSKGKRTSFVEAERKSEDYRSGGSKRSAERQRIDEVQAARRRRTNSVSCSFFYEENN